MTVEKYVAWQPLPGIPNSLYIEAIHDDVEGFRILLRGEDSTAPVLRVLFESMVGYRNINESYRNKTWESSVCMTSLPSLMTVIHSRWLDWLVEESGRVLEAKTLTHYAIYTPEDCIDVATQFPPTVDWPSR